MIALAIASGVVYLVAYVWLVIRCFKADGALIGLLTALFPLVAIISVIQHRGTSASVARPFVWMLLGTVGMWATTMHLVAEAQKQLMAAAEQDGAMTIEDLVAGDDPIRARIRLAQAQASVAFQRGEVSLPMAHAKLDVPQHFRFAPRPGLAAMAAQLGTELPGDLVGWLVHDSVSLEDDDAWFVAVSWKDIGHVAQSEPDELSTALLTPALKATIDASSDGSYQFAAFAHAPKWRAEDGLLAWGESYAFDDGSTGVDCYALRPASEGALEFAIEDFDATPESTELCLRAVRLGAAKVRYDRGYRYGDYSFWKHSRSGADLAEMITTFVQ